MEIDRPGQGEVRHQSDPVRTRSARGWRTLRLQFVLLLTAAGCAGTGGSDRPSFEELRLAGAPAADGSSQGRIGLVDIVVFGADDPRAPTLWEGPIRVRHDRAAAVCTIDKDLITRVYVERTGAGLLVQSISGSTAYIQGFSATDCAPLWPEISAFTAGIAVTGDRIDIRPGCAATDDPGVSDCTSARAYNLDAAGAPVLQPQRARALTLSDTGIAFDGRALIRDAGTSRATLVQLFEVPR
jgi:hypothetical protein